MTDPSQSVSSYYYRDNLNLNLLGLLAGEIVCPKKGSPVSDTQSPRRTRLRTPCNCGTCQVVPNLAWRPEGSWWARVAHLSALHLPDFQAVERLGTTRTKGDHPYLHVLYGVQELQRMAELIVKDSKGSFTYYGTPILRNH